MLLNEANEGKILSKTYKTLKDQGYLDRNRLSTEEQVWTETLAQDGNGEFNINNWLVKVDPPASRYVKDFVVDFRRSKPGDHTAEDGP
jgi:hypothetical protein